MPNYSFEKIKDRILTWFTLNLSDAFKEKYSVELGKNDENGLIIDFIFKHCLAQLIVSKEDFAPYDLLSFVALTGDSKKSLVSGSPELIYFFYDSAETEELEAMMELQFAVDYCRYYIPGELENKYVGKIGHLNFEKSVHPDDKEKIDCNISEDQYICVDTKFQYLVIKSNDITLKVLPRVFKIIERN